MTDFFTTGTYDANRDLVKTISPSMDILVSSNLERLIYHKSSDKIVKQKMEELNESKIFTFEGDLHEFKCGYATENETRNTIKEVFKDEGYLIDTHTAVAKNITDKLGLDKTVILSTASPYKFSSTVLKALGENISSDEFENIDLLYEKTEAKIPTEIKELHSKKIIHKTKITKNEIEDEVLKFAKRAKRISVPATSANIGPGFDALGVALDLANTCEFKLTDDKNTFEKSVESNLIYKSYQYTFDFYGEKIVPVEFDLDTNIPMSRGLGSSAACIVMGIMAAFSVMEKNPDKKEILKIATQIEGHPDNVAPAIFADAVASILKDDEVFVEKFEISDKYKFLAIIPDFELSTQKAREVLPENYTKNDAVFNVSRVSMLVLSLISGNENNLKIALEDKIHEPYRLQLIPEIEKIDEIIENSNAIGHYLSGAGSTIMVILKSDDTTLESEIRNKLNNLSNSYEIMQLDIDKKGAFII